MGSEVSLYFGKQVSCQKQFMILCFKWRSASLLYFYLSVKHSHVFAFRFLYIIRNSDGCDSHLGIFSLSLAFEYQKLATITLAIACNYSGTHSATTYIAVSSRLCCCFYFQFSPQHCPSRNNTYFASLLRFIKKRMSGTSRYIRYCLQVKVRATSTVSEMNYFMQIVQFTKTSILSCIIPRYSLFFHSIIFFISTTEYGSCLPWRRSELVLAVGSSSALSLSETRSPIFRSILWWVPISASS